MGITVRVLIDTVVVHVPGSINTTVGFGGVGRNTSAASGGTLQNANGQCNEDDQIQNVSDSG